MLKIIGLILISIQLAWATSEPQELFVISNGKVQKIDFSKLKTVEVLAVNHHPNFIKNGKSKYKGFLIKDILSSFKLKDNQAVTIVGKTGQFSIEVRMEELLEGQNLIATHVNGHEVQTGDNGLQIIYSEKTLEKYPHLKQRQFWCWWVRSIVLDQKYVPRIEANIEKNKLTSEFPWPVPYGISSVEQVQSPSERYGRVLSNFKKISLTLLNGAEKTIANDGKTKFFVADLVSNKMGAFSLHQLIEKNGKIETFLNNYYYVKSLRVIE